MSQDWVAHSTAVRLYSMPYCLVRIKDVLRSELGRNPDEVLHFYENDDYLVPIPSDAVIAERYLPLTDHD